MNHTDKLHRADFIQAFVVCALWATYDHADPSGGEPLENNFSESDFDPVTKATLTTDCEAFMDANASNLVDFPSGEAGHDFFLTRNHHGAGFWDRDYGNKDLRSRLTNSSHSFGETDIYVGDDKKLYI